MFDVLVFMFENYFANHAQLDNKTMEQELSEAGFKKNDIDGAFDWIQQMKSMMNAPALYYEHHASAMRCFSPCEQKKINLDSQSFIIFLQQAQVINDVERDLIIDRAMALKQAHICIEEIRWIAMVTLWNKGREKDYAFVEDAVFNPRGLTIQ